MLDNRRVTSLIGTMVSAAVYSIPVAVLTGALSDMAWQSNAPGLYNGLAVGTVIFWLTGTAFYHWWAAQKIAWNMAHAPQPINVTVQGGGTAEREYPELGPDDKPIYHKAVKTNAGAFATEAAVLAIEPRALVNPRVPAFITVTQATELAYACIKEGAEINHREWVKVRKMPNGKPAFSDEQFRKLRKWMLDRGFWEKVRDTDNSPVVMTERGRVWMESIVTAFPRPARVYRHKA